MKRGMVDRANDRAVVPAVAGVDGTTDIDALRRLALTLNRLDQRAAGVFHRLMALPAVTRMGLNLIQVARQLMQHDVTNVVGDGLAPEERDALMAIHALAPGMDVIGTAHALLCIEARARFLREWGPVMEEERTKKLHTYAGHTTPEQ